MVRPSRPGRLKKCTNRSPEDINSKNYDLTLESESILNELYICISKEVAIRLALLNPKIYDRRWKFMHCINDVNNNCFTTRYYLDT